MKETLVAILLLVLLLFLLADVVLILNSYHHWDDTIKIEFSYAGNSKIMNCGIVKPIEIIK